MKREGTRRVRPAAGDAAAEVMIGCLEALGPVGRVLVAEDGPGVVANALKTEGVAIAEWQRLARPGRDGTVSAWPADGVADAAVVRLPKSREALALVLHAVAARLPPGAPIAVFGGNDEGIRSAAASIGQVAEDVTTLDARRHARVILGRRRGHIEGHKPELADWRRVASLDIGGVARAWVSYPGVFARGGLDTGTAMLLEHLPVIRDDDAVLDFAAGTGVIGAAVLDRAPGVRLDLLEADAIALAAARENVPQARAILGSGLADAKAPQYRLILSNPPIHDGIAESREVLDALIREAPRRLAANGEMRLVVQRRIPVREAMAAVFGEVEVVADDGRYTVVAGRRRAATARPDIGAPAGAVGASRKGGALQEAEALLAMARVEPDRGDEERVSGRPGRGSRPAGSRRRGARPGRGTGSGR